MKKKISLYIAFIVTVAYAQAQFNDYKYIVVPTKFAKFNNENQYQTSTLTKFHIAKHGFNVIYNNAVPKELTENRCLGLWVELVDKSSLFATKVQLNFKDCYGDTVYLTGEGRTKIKDYKGAYAAAIAQAAASLKDKEHNYVEKEPKKDAVTAKKAESTATVSIATEQTLNTAKEVTAEPVESKVVEVAKKSVVEVPTTVESKNELLYAQPTQDGYQLVDTTPAVRYTLEATSVDNVFLVNQEGINGVVLKKGDQWFLEYKGPEGKVSKELFIKF